MLKIILYAYTQRVFSCRKIEFLLDDSYRMRLLANTDTDATLMRMKDDYMRKWQLLKPGYHLQIAT